MDGIVQLISNHCSYRELEREVEKRGLTMKKVISYKNKCNQNVAHIICTSGNIKLLKYHEKFPFDCVDNKGNLPIYYMLEYIEKNLDKMYILQKLISYGLMSNSILEQVNYFGEKIMHKLEQVLKLSTSSQKSNENNEFSKHDQDHLHTEFYKEIFQEEDDDGDNNSYFNSFEDGSRENPAYETFDHWCDRIAKEFKAKYSFSDKPTRNAQRKRKATNRNTKEDIKSAEPTTTNKTDLGLLYQQWVKRFDYFIHNSTKRSLLVDDFPWPIELCSKTGGANHKSSSSAVTVTPKMNDNQLTELCKRMGEILMYGSFSKDQHPSISNESITKFVRSQRIFWHPDKFQAKYKSLTTVSHIELVCKLALNMSQLFNNICNQLYNINNH